MGVALANSFFKNYQGVKLQCLNFKLFLSISIYTFLDMLKKQIKTIIDGLISAFKEFLFLRNVCIICI